MNFGIIKKEIDKWDPIELLACTRRTNTISRAKR